MTFPPYPAPLSNPVIGVSPPKVTVWDGSTDGDWTDATNWTNGAPNTSDDVICSQVSGADISQDIDTYNASGTTLERFMIEDGFTGQVGGDTGTLTVNAKELRIRKTFGRISLRGTFLTTHIMDTPAGDNAVVLNAPNSNGNRLEDVYIYATRGEVKIQNSSTLNNIYVVPYPGRTVKLTIGTGVVTDDQLAANTHIKVIRANPGAFLFSGSGGNDVRASGGVVDFTDSGASEDITISAGGHVTYQSSGNIGGRVTTWDGEFTLYANSNSTVVLSDGTSYGKGRMDLRNTVGAFSLSNDIDYYGGEVLVDGGLTETIA